MKGVNRACQKEPTTDLRFSSSTAPQQENRLPLALPFACLPPYWSSTFSPSFQSLQSAAIHPRSSQTCCYTNDFAAPQQGLETMQYYHSSSLFCKFAHCSFLLSIAHETKPNFHGSCILTRPNSISSSSFDLSSIAGETNKNLSKWLILSPRCYMFWNSVATAMLNFFRWK